MVIELFHGPTYAFKDVALQVLGNLFAYFLNRQSVDSGVELERLTILGATSGDTGSAALAGLRSKPGIEVYILHPAGRISDVQEAQMTSILDKNVHNIAVEGTFDMCQEIVKVMFGERKLGAVNSINWARIMAQMSYYFSSYFSLVKAGKVELGEQVVYSVPTGNFGDVLAGWYARQMGLNIRFIVATNANDILHTFFETGDVIKTECKSTCSPAMDILVSSNFERVLWYYLDGQSDKVKEYMRDLKEKGGFKVDKDVLNKMKEVFKSARVDDKQTKECIRKYHPGYILDPHTAVGIVSAEQEQGLVVCLATASPGKFPTVVLDALQGRNVAFEDFAPKELVDVRSKPRKCVYIPTGGDFERALQGVRKVLDAE